MESEKDMVNNSIWRYTFKSDFLDITYACLYVRDNTSKGVVRYVNLKAVYCNFGSGSTIEFV